ncbi:MAG: DUF3016 domain-containing protein [Methylococcales bacterium]
MNKPSIIALLGVLSLVSARNGRAEVNVKFIEPENYTDLSLSGSSTDRIQRHILDELSKFLVDLGARTLPAGQKLEVEVYDIDMAGNYEPWRAPFLTNTRIVRDVYRQRMDIHYILRNAQGSVVKERWENFSDLNYLITANPYAYLYNDPLRYEKALLRKWFNANFEGRDASEHTH